MNYVTINFGERDLIAASAICISLLCKMRGERRQRTNVLKLPSLRSIGSTLFTSLIKCPDVWKLCHLFNASSNCSLEI